MVEGMAEAGLASRSRDGFKCYAPGGRQETGLGLKTDKLARDGGRKIRAA